MNYSDINLNNKIVTYDRVAGKQGESFVKGVRFILPSEYDDWDVVVDTQNARGEKNSYQVVKTANNLVEYSFNSVDLKYKGKLLIDLVLIHGQKILKPFSGEFAVKEAICPGDSYGDFIPIIITSDISNEIRMNTELRHKHDNKTSVLDKFSLDENGGLLFDGEPIKAEGVVENVDEKIQQIIRNGNFASKDDLVNYRRTNQQVPANEVGYSNPTLEDKSGTIQGALNEAIEYITTVIPAIQTEVDSKQEEGDYVTTKQLEASFDEAKASGEFSGIYVGTGEMPDGYNVHINPDGDETIIPTKTSELTNDSGFVQVDYLEYATPQMFGAVGDGVTDDTEAVTRALNSGKNAVFDGSKTYLISSTIVVPENANVDFGGATIKPNGDFDVIRVKPGSYVENLIVRCADVAGWDSSAIVLYGGDGFSASNPTRLRNIKMYNDTKFNNGYSVGNGIYFYLDKDGRYIEGVTASDVLTCGFGYGIRMSDLISEDEYTGNRGFIGANNFPNYWSFKDKVGICMDAKSAYGLVTNNFFTDLNIQSDYYESSQYAIYCRGDSNYFSGCLYDYIVLDYHPATAIYFDVGSTKNYVEVTAGRVNDAGYCVDLGLHNKVVKHHITDTIITPYNAEMGVAGNQDDVFAFLDKRSRCTLDSLDVAPSTGDISSVFDPSPSNVLTYYKSPSTGKCRAVITINLNKVLRRMTHLILQFPFRHSPTTIKVTVFNAETAKTIYDTSNNAEYNIIISPVLNNDIGYIDDISKIVIELGGTYSFSGLNQSYWSISRIMAVDGYVTGNTWLRRDGGEIYGNIKFTKGNGAILASENGKKYLLTVSDDGVLSTTEWIEQEEEAPESAILIPVMASGATWYNTELAGVAQNTITSVTFNMDYKPTGNEDASWACDDSGIGHIMAYRNGTDIIITATTGASNIKLNPESTGMFANDNTNANFSSLTRVGGTECWVADKGTYVSRLFQGNTLITEPVHIPEGVTAVNNIYHSCSALTRPPVIPEGVTALQNAFLGCKAMTIMPNIPSTAKNLYYFVGNCSSIVDVDAIVPESAINIEGAFRNCYVLNGNIEVNATNLTSYVECFANTCKTSGAVTLTGSCPILAELAATNTQGKVIVGQ